ncbi:glutathione S-transferase family protein [Alcanivorax quisquiliarum]|uniref:Glutathione S-transferase family protein n=1 Tax=Alcanivorax quisquiliarum TaxID=2933565 RepID=A0ABT0E2X4_9GAMM|nr:glutathione S-transferase family protein [Alcanivorax quisquiliarum]MCK0536162.1 glutathione S-transferase family protein [Alcanivorax quisquiliarum]
MTRQYRIYGLEMSPYSIKVRSWFRYKQLPHEWIGRSMERMPEFQSLARLPLVPLVQCPDGEVMQDSTPIIEWLEARHPAPPTQPASPLLAFLSALIEEYADEWLNKPMFHYRWSRPADCASAALRIAREQLPGQPDEQLANMVAFLQQRMVPRLSLVGSSAETGPLIEQSFRQLLVRLEPLLAKRAYLFGARPCLADFGLYGQLQQLASDPTPAALMKEHAPATLAWLARMDSPPAGTDTGGSSAPKDNPHADTEFDSEAALLADLEPLLREQVLGYYLPWAQANEQAVAAGEEHFSVALPGGLFTQQPQKYHARSLAMLRQRRAAVTVPLPDWLPAF